MTDYEQDNPDDDDERQKNKKKEIAERTETVQAYETDAAAQVKEFFRSVPGRVNAIDNMIKDKFPFAMDDLQEAERAFDQQLRRDTFYAHNSVLADILPDYRNTISQAIQDFLGMEHWVLLSRNKMDPALGGPVFDIQMELMANLQRCRAELQEALDGILEYYKQRKSLVVDGCGYSYTMLYKDNITVNATMDGGNNTFAWIPVPSATPTANTAPRIVPIVGSTSAANDVDVDAPMDANMEQPPPPPRLQGTFQSERRQSQGMAEELAWPDGIQAVLTLEVNMYVQMHTLLCQTQAWYKATYRVLARIRTANVRTLNKFLCLKNLLCPVGPPTTLSMPVP